MTCCSRALAVPLVHQGQRLCTEAAGLSDLHQCRPKATNWHWHASMAQGELRWDGVASLFGSKGQTRFRGLCYVFLGEDAQPREKE